MTALPTLGALVAVAGTKLLIERLEHLDALPQRRGLRSGVGVKQRLDETARDALSALHAGWSWQPFTQDVSLDAHHTLPEKPSHELMNANLTDASRQFQRKNLIRD